MAAPRAPVICRNRAADSRFGPYSIPSEAICIIGALVILREKVLRPILAGVGKRKSGRKPKNWSLIDEHYETIRQDMFTPFRRPAHRSLETTKFCRCYFGKRLPSQRRSVRKYWLWPSPLLARSRSSNACVAK